MTLVNLGNVYERAGQVEAAEKHYRKALAENSTDYSAVFNLGLCMRRQGELEDAAGLFTLAARLKPEALEPLLLGAGTLRQAEEYGPAREMVLRVLELEPESLPALLQASALSHLMGEAEPAAAHLDAAIAIDPERVKARVGRDEALDWALERL